MNHQLRHTSGLRQQQHKLLLHIQHQLMTKVITAPRLNLPLPLLPAPLLLPLLLLLLLT
jgi:hypothetical protein